MFRSINVPPRELRAASHEYVAARLGVRLKNMNPHAESMLSDGVSLKDLAAQCAYAMRQELGERSPAGEHPGRVVGLGMGTADFQNALENGARMLVFQNYDALSSDYHAITKPMPVKDFRAIGLPTLDVGDEAQLLIEGAEKETSVITTVEGLTARLATYFKLFLLTREAIVNDDIALFETAFTQAAAAIARTEARQVFGLLESNPTLGDSSPMFDASLGNLITANMDAAGLGAAMAALRNQPTAAGNKANNEAAIMLVPAASEFAALALVCSISVDKPRLQVIAAPWLTSGPWYLFADPAVSPVLGLLHLAGNQDGRTVSVQARKPKKVEQDGVALMTWTDFGVAALGRVGAIKVQP